MSRAVSASWAIKSLFPIKPIFFSDEEMAEQDLRHSQEMAVALEQDSMGGGDEARINGLAAQHMEERQMLQLRWESELSKKHT